MNDSNKWQLTESDAQILFIYNAHIFIHINQYEVKDRLLYEGKWAYAIYSVLNKCF